MKRRAGAALLLLAASWPAAAGPLEVQAPDGSGWRVNEDDETRLERLAPDGRLDMRFGKGGFVEYTLGHADAGTAALRVDAQGRIWTAGNSAASGSSGPVVMRFSADGTVDTRWGVGGRNSATPPGQRLVVVDLLPMPDGSVWIAGNALSSPAGQHAAVWRINADGSLDFRFGAGGLWQRPGRERTRAISLADAPDGRIAFGLETPEGNRTVREIYLLDPGAAAPQAGERSLADDEDDEQAYLEWVGQTWRWERGDQVAAVSGLAAEPAPATTGADTFAASANDPGHGGFNPFDAASAPPPVEVPPEELPWGLIIGGGALVAGLLGLWGWRVRSERGSGSTGSGRR